MNRIATWLLPQLAALLLAGCAETIILGAGAAALMAGDRRPTETYLADEGIGRADDWIIKGESRKGKSGVNWHGFGKLAAGFVAGKGMNPWLVGWGMVPRGEVGLIFAMVGKKLGVMSEAMFSVIVIMVILTTLLTPPILTVLLRRQLAK